MLVAITYENSSMAQFMTMISNVNVDSVQAVYAVTETLIGPGLSLRKSMSSVHQDIEGSVELVSLAIVRKTPSPKCGVTSTLYVMASV